MNTSWVYFHAVVVCRWWPRWWRCTSPALWSFSVVQTHCQEIVWAASTSPSAVRKHRHTHTQWEVSRNNAWCVISLFFNQATQSVWSTWSPSTSLCSCWVEEDTPSVTWPAAGPTRPLWPWTRTSLMVKLSLLFTHKDSTLFYFYFVSHFFSANVNNFRRLMLTLTMLLQMCVCFASLMGPISAHNHKIPTENCWQFLQWNTQKGGH